MIQENKKEIVKPIRNTQKEKILGYFDDAIENLGKYIISYEQHLHAMDEERKKVEEAMEEAKKKINEIVECREYLSKKLK